VAPSWVDGEEDELDELAEQTTAVTVGGDR
jgi:hypothetical protein